MYFGIGAHGEKGVRKTTLLSADETAKMLTDEVVGDLKLSSGEAVNLIVNGYGSTTLMELFIVNRKVHEILRSQQVSIYMTEVGNFLTTQEMAGCSVTLMRLDDELKKLCEAPASTPAYRL
jgi:dihydroxyacetone kinase-like protein